MCFCDQFKKKGSYSPFFFIVLPNARHVTDRAPADNSMLLSVRIVVPDVVMSSNNRMCLCATSGSISKLCMSVDALRLLLIQKLLVDLRLMMQCVPSVSQGFFAAKDLADFVI